MPDSFELQCRAPWELDRVTFVTNLPEVKKSDCSPDQLRSMAYEAIHTYTQTGDIMVYTDRSLDPETSRAGCGVVIRQGKRTIRLSWRVNNLASSLQTELLAMYFALDTVRQHSANTSTVIITFASNQSAKCGKVRDNVQIVHSIKDLLAECHRVTIIWVPSHIGIKGNELADRLAKKSLTKRSLFTDLPSISISRQGKYIQRHAEDSTLNHMLATAEESPTFAQMVERTKLIPPLRIPNAAPDIICFTFVLLGYKHPKQQPFLNIDRFCPDCDCPFSIEHHFFERAHTDNTPQETLMTGSQPPATTSSTSQRTRLVLRVVTYTLAAATSPQPYHQRLLRANQMAIPCVIQTPSPRYDDKAEAED